VPQFFVGTSGFSYSEWRGKFYPRGLKPAEMLGYYAHRLHTVEVGGGESYGDRVFGGLTDDQMRRRPASGLNSLVWLLWHMARTEDVAVNLVVSDGRQVDQKDGFFLGPTIFDRVTPNMKIWKEELFGPVLSVMRATDIDEALKLLNASTYGNMASIFTTSGKNAREFKRRAQAGMLGVNIGVAAPMAFFPFTGWKNSFFGDLHATGQDSIRFYTRHKVVTTRWL